MLRWRPSFSLPVASAALLLISPWSAAASRIDRHDRDVCILTPFRAAGNAAYWEYLCTDATHPEFNIMAQFASTTVSAAMGATQFGHSRKLTAPDSEVDSSAAIESQFDGVAYQFGE